MLVGGSTALFLEPKPINRSFANFSQSALRASKNARSAASFNRRSSLGDFVRKALGPDGIGLAADWYAAFASVQTFHRSGSVRSIASRSGQPCDGFVASISSIKIARNGRIESACQFSHLRAVFACATSEVLHS